MEEYDIVEEMFFGGLECITYFKKGTKILHRLDGPAVEFSSGFRSWFVNGKRHKIEWYVDGVRLSPEKEIIMNLWYENGRI